MEEAETDSEDELPPGWEARVSAEGKVYYANHLNKSTQYAHPLTGKRRKVEGGLPYGWRMIRDADGHLVYEDTIKQRRTYTDPRLAFAVEDDVSLNPFSSSNSSIPQGEANATRFERSALGSRSFAQRFDSYATAMNVLDGQDLRNLSVIVTGANCGIGFETARALALHGAHVTLACRSDKVAEEAVNKIVEELAAQSRRATDSDASVGEREDPGNCVQAMHLDLASLDSVRHFANEYRKRVAQLDVLVLNAAVFAPPFSITVDGYESTLAVNHVGHFYLTRLLLDLLFNPNRQRSATRQLKRIVVVSSESHRGASFCCADELVDLFALNASSKKYIGMVAYNDSKLCNLLFVHELHRRLESLHQDENGSAERCRVCVFGVHPGNLVRTQLSRNWWVYNALFWLVRPFTKSLEQAAATSCFAVFDRQLECFNGAYLNNCCWCEPSRAARDAALASRLWMLSDQCIDKFERENPL